MTDEPTRLLVEQFEANRSHLRSVAYRMLGSLAEADDAVQESWLHLSRAGTSGVNNLGGWLTTVVARVCLDMLRSRESRREESLGEHIADPIASREDGIDPEHEAVTADSVGPAAAPAPCTRRLARLASCLAAVEDRPTIGAISSKGTPNRSCRTKASRS